MRRPIRILLIILLFPPTLAAVGGWLAGPSFLHPIRRELSPGLIREADVTFEQIGARRKTEWELGFGLSRRGGQSHGRS